MKKWIQAQKEADRAIKKGAKSHGKKE